MACPNCNKNDTVTIGQKNYCTNCGTAIPAATAGSVNDIAAKPAPAPVASTPVAAPVMPTPAPIAPAVTPPAPAAVTTPTSTPTPQAQPKPAQQFHGAPTGRGAVLDLRAMPQPKPAPTPVAVAPEPAPVPSVSVSAGSAKKEARIANATSVSKSEMVQKFPQSPQPAASAAPAPTPAPTPTPTPMPATAAPAVNPIAPQPVRPQFAAPDIRRTASAIPAPAPTPAAPTALPNQVASQINAMQNLISADTLSSINPAAARKEAFKMAMTDDKPAPEPKGGPRALSVAAAAFAVLIMGGYIWLQNYPKLAIRVAGNKAGIEASIPGYVPASYNLSGPITYSPGQITLTFSSTGSSGRMTIAERKTQWDSGSLLENYVSRKTKDYLAVQNQGLTIYLYGGNQASWVNKGIWYSIEGDTQLSRDQVLKVASSL